MKNKLFKVTGLIFSGVLTAGMLLGCGAKEVSTDANTTTKDVAVKEEAETPKTESSEQETIVMGTNAEFEPFEYRDNGTDIVGFDVEIAKQIASKLGKKLVIEDMAFDSLIMALNSDKIDFVAAGMTATDERKTQVDFSDTYFHSKQMIIVKADNTTIHTADDLVGKKVGVQLGTTGDLFVSGTEGVEVTQFPTGTAAVMDLKNGQLDAVVIDAEPAKKMIEGQADVKVLDAPFIEEEYAIAVKKGDKELLEGINSTLKEIEENGTYDKLYAQFFAAE